MGKLDGVGPQRQPRPEERKELPLRGDSECKGFPRATPADCQEMPRFANSSGLRAISLCHYIFQRIQVMI